MLVNLSVHQESNKLVPPITAEIGVTGNVAPSPGMIMGKIQIQPGVRSFRQYIINADLALFVVNGSGKLITGPVHDTITDTFEDKDFIFIEAGEIFTLKNTGERVCTLVFTIVGVENLDELIRTFLERPEF